MLVIVMADVWSYDLPEVSYCSWHNCIIRAVEIKDASLNSVYYFTSYNEADNQLPEKHACFKIVAC